MGVEYHGWVALATSQDDWNDGDFEEGFHRVRELLRDLVVENGHEPLMPDGTLLPQMIYLKGSQAGSLAPVLHILQEITAVFDKSYGELAVFDDSGGQSHCFDSAIATRYRLVGGNVLRVDHD